MHIAHAESTWHAPSLHSSLPQHAMILHHATISYITTTCSITITCIITCTISASYSIKTAYSVTVATYSFNAARLIISRSAWPFQHAPVHAPHLQHAPVLQHDFTPTYPFTTGWYHHYIFLCDSISHPFGMTLHDCNIPHNYRMHAYNNILNCCKLN